MNKATTHTVLPCPQRPTHLPVSSQWLSGEGCGSWFHLEIVPNGYLISRYNPEGKIECKGYFNQVAGPALILNQSYKLTYLSHCAEVNLIQSHHNLKFILIQKIS